MERSVDTRTSPRHHPRRMTRSSVWVRVLRSGVADADALLVTEVDGSWPPADGLEPHFGTIAHRAELTRAAAVPTHVERDVRRDATGVRHGFRNATDLFTTSGARPRFRV